MYLNQAFVLKRWADTGLLITTHNIKVDLVKKVPKQPLCFKIIIVQRLMKSLHMLWYI